jgi:hypothetical protein
VFRRQFLLTAPASALVTSAAAQEQKADPELDVGPVKGTEELWYLLTALDALIFCMAVAVIKDQAVIVQARREVQPYTSQLSDPKAEEAFNAALKSSEGQARIEQNKTAISDAANEIDALLTDVVSPPVRASVVHAFARSSTLLNRPRGRKRVVVVPRLYVPESAVLAETRVESGSDRFWLSARAYARGATTYASKSRPRQTPSAFRRQVKVSLPPGSIPEVGSSATCRPRPVSLVATSAWVFQSSRV